MFNINSNMLLEGTSSLFGDTRIANSQITNENYFDTALETANAIEAEYTEAKAKLYNGLATSTEEFKGMFSKAYNRSFPEKDKKSVNESCTSTDYFVSFFGKSVEILNKAAGNIANSCSGICKQVPIVTKEAAKTLGVLEKTELCPVCNSEPCSCKKRENLFKFTTDHGIKVTDFDFPAMDNAISKDADFKKIYDSMVSEAADVASKRRAVLSGLDSPVDITLFGEAVISNFRSTNRYPIAVNHRYLDYCIETVNSYNQRVDKMVSDVKKIATSFTEAANKVANVMTASSTMKYIKEDGNVENLANEDQVQNMDLYCKAKVDELVASCMEYIISIGAKLDAMKCEYDQCKAVLSKYKCGNPEVAALPVQPPVVVSISRDDEDKDTDPAGADGITPDSSTIQEDPNSGEVDYTTEYEESYMPWAVNDYTDIRDMEDYRDSYTSFLVDMVAHEVELSSYINGELLAESDQVFIEGALGKTKGLLHSISEFIKKIWGKFKNAMAGVFQNDQKYLANNENTIKNVQCKSAQIDGWYNYNRALITNDTNTLATVNREMSNLVNASKLLSNMNSTSQPDPKIAQCGDKTNGMTNAFVTYFKACDNPKENNTNDKFRTYFRKYPISINANTLTSKERSEMYDFCYDFKQSVQDVLQKDVDAIEEMRSAAEESLQQLMNAVETNEANMKKKAEEEAAKEQKEQQNQQTVQQGGQKTTEDNKQHEATDLSSVIDQYFTELSIGPTSNASDSSAGNSTTAAAVNKPENMDNIKNASSAGNDQVAKSMDSNATKANAEIIERYIKNVFDLTKQYAAIKISMAQNAYNQYMSLFRWHVGQYAGTDKQQQSGGNNIDTSQATVDTSADTADTKTGTEGEQTEPKKKGFLGKLKK